MSVQKQYVAQCYHKLLTLLAVSKLYGFIFLLFLSMLQFLLRSFMSDDLPMNTIMNHSAYLDTSQCSMLHLSYVIKLG